MKSKIIICHDKVNLKETNDFNLIFLSFARDDFDYYNPSAQSLFEILLMKAKEFEATTLPKGTRENYMFTPKEDVDNIVADDNDAYIVTASSTRQFTVNVNCSADKIEVQGVHLDSSR